MPFRVGEMSEKVRIFISKIGKWGIRMKNKCAKIFATIIVLLIFLCVFMLYNERNVSHITVGSVTSNSDIIEGKEFTVNQKFSEGNYQILLNKNLVFFILCSFSILFVWTTSKSEKERLVRLEKLKNFRKAE